MLRPRFLTLHSQRPTFNLRCAFATLSPKVTSKRTKSRHFLFPGVPVERLTRRQSRSPTQNHVLEANETLSKRERHWRHCLAKSMCVSFPHNPDITQLLLPYWLRVRPEHERFKVHVALLPHLQSVNLSRLVRAFASLRDAEQWARWKHTGLVTDADLEQARSLDAQVKQLGPQQLMPLFDRVLQECEQVFLKVKAEEVEAVLEAGKLYQHGLSVQDVQSVLGAEETDVGRAVLEKRSEVTADTRRMMVERIVGIETANAEQLNAMKCKRIQDVFGKHGHDCGSAQVQAALYTFRIRNMCQHVYDHPQDTNSRVKLDEMTDRRRKFLAHLMKTDFSAAMDLIKQLGLKAV